MALNRADLKTLLDATIFTNGNRGIKAANHNDLVTELIDSLANLIDDTLGHTIQDDGTDKTDRTNLNFIGATVADNVGNDSTDITIDSGGGHEIQDNGTPLATQPALNFIGATVADNPGNSSTDVTVPTGVDEKEIQFNSNADNIVDTTWTGKVVFNTLSPITGGLTSVSYETRLDSETEGDWVARADLAAVNTYVTGFGSSTTGTQWRLRTTGNYGVSEFGLESITLIYSR